MARLTPLVAGRVRLKTTAEKIQRRIRRLGAETPELKSPVRAPFRNLIFDQVVREHVRRHWSMRCTAQAHFRAGCYMGVGLSAWYRPLSMLV